APLGGMLADRVGRR
ncbi:hypothetical protein, partial [Corallococcus exiguus]